MKVIVALCLVVVGASALPTKGVFGASGIVYPDGTNVQFTYDQADNIVLVGPSGAVTKDGTNYQFTDAGVPSRSKRSMGVFGASGIVYPDGTNVQFTYDQADNIVLVGPSGAVTKDGTNYQFTDAGVPSRSKRSMGVFGASGIVYPDGTNVQFTYDQADNIVLVGPSGAVTKDGTNYQFTDAGVPSRSKRALVGDSGIVTPKGDLHQLGHGVEIVVAGPSGAVLSNGEHIQYRK
ncbi:hypothetical protein Pmani_025117 [Petrolisthes manimaculis]|uniref:Cuticle protein n=1 Tax=Petrolisthes manimaculis TaxID=1843537 RepID=A0AAE1P687_9EUCA|nr:hypothetical protein Pmani_025115 [Petrolisthes manimaculis]KAK4302831.1 hypothetical protein Pmani_025117 [Petrolisthes manimaculis]